MKIYRATDPLPVDDQPLVFLLVGGPGIGKTSIGYSFQTLLLDCDQGSYRAVNRRDTAPIRTWHDVAGMTPADVEGYAGVTVDTVERLTTLLTLALLDESAKWGSQGVLYPQGHQVLRARFAQWLDRLASWGLDVVLLAHAKEDRDGEHRRVRADIPGAVANECLKRADFVAHIYQARGERVVDFTKTDAFPSAKNSGRWAPFRLPPIDQAADFLEQRFVDARKAVAACNARSAAIGADEAVLRREVQACRTAEACTAFIARANSLPDNLKPQVKRFLVQHARACGFVYDDGRAAYVAPAGAPATAPPAPAARVASAASWQPALLSTLTGTDGAR